MITLVIRNGLLSLGFAWLLSFGTIWFGVDPEEIWHFQELTAMTGFSMVSAALVLIMAKHSPIAFSVMASSGLIALACMNVFIGIDYNGTHHHAMRRNAGLNLADLVDTYRITHASSAIGSKLAPDLDVQQIMVFEDKASENGAAGLAFTLAGYLESSITSWSADVVEKVAFPDVEGGYRTVALGPGLSAHIDPTLIEAEQPAAVDLCIILRADALVLTVRGCPPGRTDLAEDLP